MKEKRRWSKWFDRLDDEKLSYLLKNKDKLKNIAPEADQKIRHALKNAGDIGVNNDVFALETPPSRNKILGFTLAWAGSLIVILLLSAFLIKNRFIDRQPWTSASILAADVKGGVYYLDEYGTEIPVKEHFEIKKDVIFLTENNAGMTLAKKNVFRIDMKENSQLMISDETDKTVPFIMTGGASFDVNKKELRKDFIVETELFDIRITGTKFQVGADEKGCRVTVYEGKVKVLFKYDFNKEIKILGQKDRMFAGIVGTALNEEFDLADGAALTVDKSDFIRNETSIKVLLNGYKKSSLSGKEKKDLIEKMEKLKVRNYTVSQPEVTNISSSSRSSNRSSQSKVITQSSSSKMEIPAVKSEAGIKDEGLIGEWLFSGNAFDSSGNANNGIVKNAQLTNDRFGNPDSAYYFNGRSSIRVKNNKTLEDIETTGLFSYSIWIYIGNWYRGNLFSIIDKYSKQSGFGYIIECHNAEGIFFTIDIFNRFYSRVVASPNEWYHIVFINDSIRHKACFYIDGKKAGEENRDFKLKTDSDLYIGCGPSGETEYAIGKIDDLRIFKYALTEEQVQKLYTEGGWTDKK